MATAYPYYIVNGRTFATYPEARLYWQARGGVLLEKLDSKTPAHVLLQS
jgi:hypothetical protein